MAVVDQINIILGTDRQFDLRILKRDGDPYPLTDGNLNLTLTLPGEDNDINLNLTPNVNSSGLSVSSAEGGRITVTIDDVDSSLLRIGDGQSMELTIQEGAGPNFIINKVQYINKFNVKKMLFE